MKMLSFARRNRKEMLRDPLTFGFGIGFPLILLLLLSLIQANVPVPMFQIDALTPGVAAFGLSFVSLFSGMTIAKDRANALMLRLLTSPMKASDFILGYTLPLLPLMLAQMGVCYLAAIALGLECSLRIPLALVCQLPAAFLFIALGLLCGSVFTDKQVGGVCGALLTNLSAWLSGTWFDLAFLGKDLQRFAQCLPFCHGVDAGRYALGGEYGKILPEMLWVMGYAAALLLLAVILFTKKMRSDAC